MNKRMIQVVVFFLAMLLVSATVTGQNLTKEDFAKLQGKDRTFYFVGLELAYSKLDYKSTYKEDLGPIVSQLDGEFVEAIPVEKLKSSIEEKLDLKVNTMAFNMKFENRKDNGFFNKDVEASERFIYHKWTVPSRKNQLILSVFLYKTGTMIKVNQAKIEIRFLVLNKEGTAYDTLLYTSQDKSWKDYRELYSILKESCVIE